MKPDVCPNCGAEVPEQARACPECGSDAQTGWSEDAHYGNLGIEYEDEFDYEKFVEREFHKKKSSTGIKWIWVVTALIIIIALGMLWVKF